MKFVKDFRMNSIIVVVKSTFVDENNINFKHTFEFKHQISTIICCGERNHMRCIQYIKSCSLSIGSRPAIYAI